MQQGKLYIRLFCLSLLGALVLVAIPFSNTQAAPAQIMAPTCSTLRQGSSDSSQQVNVAVMQARLVHFEADPGRGRYGTGRDGVDGIFGPKTLAAVKAFQGTHTDAQGQPLEVDGVVGPKTWGALGGCPVPGNSATKSAPVACTASYFVKFFTSNGITCYSQAGYIEPVGSVSQIYTSINTTGRFIFVVKFSNSATAKPVLLGPGTTHTFAPGVTGTVSRIYHETAPVTV